MASFSLRPSILQPPPPPPIGISQRSIDPHAIDISSIKGRFAWEKIPYGDTYVPVIFRDTKKYFCVKMLNKILPEYPEDVIRRSSSYQYRKPIDLYIATPNEVELLNRINVQHAHWAYSRQPFASETELVPAADFLPFYEHLQSSPKQLLSSAPSSSISRTSSVGSIRQTLPQTQKILQHSSDFIVDIQNANRRNSLITIPMQPQIVNEVSRNNICSAPHPNLQPSRNFPPPPASNYNMLPIEVARQALQQEISTTPSRQPIATTSTNILNSTNSVSKNKLWTNSPSTSSSHSSTSTTPILVNGSDSPISTPLSSMHINNRKSSIESLEQQRISSRKQSVPIASTSKSIHPYSGWLQINKLYTPFISTDPSNHQLYRIPVSLLTFYDLLKYPSSDNHVNELKDSSINMEQTLVTQQEIELINELCLKQNIKPFAIDTKLISLATFYRYYSANTIFVKELPLNDPKSAICKNWLSIVQINGGICRLRNITTLQEQTVPFIGKNLVKIFQLSSQCLSSASIVTPTSSELQFIQLILFFCNISINLRNVKLIDIESVQKEYTVDLILLYNDKFPTNVLNYQQQQQGNRSSSSQEQIHQSQTSATTNTFAESTPPPSPRSSSPNHIQLQPISQIPLNSSIPSLISSSSSSLSSSSTAASNRFQKMITFRGHRLTAYICSGLDTATQRECVSVRELCNMLYPNSLIIDKLESKMLRLLRAKNINRFRPQNQHALGFTRLVDIKDIDIHWNFLQQEMDSSSSHIGEINNNTNVFLPITSTTITAITAIDNHKIANSRKNVLIEKSIEIDKNGKRALEREMEIDNISTMVQVDKRTRLSSEKQVEQQTINKKSVVHSNTDDGRDIQMKEMDKSPVNESNQSILIKIPKKSVPIIENIPKKNNIKPRKRLIQRKSKPTINKPMASSQNTTNVPAKKKIRLVRKRLTPRLRSNEQKLAAWVKKYNIEECFVRLDLCEALLDVGQI